MVLYIRLPIETLVVPSTRLVIVGDCVASSSSGSRLRNRLPTTSPLHKNCLLFDLVSRLIRKLVLFQFDPLTKFPVVPCGQGTTRHKLTKICRDITYMNRHAAEQTWARTHPHIRILSGGSYSAR